MTLCLDASLIVKLVTPEPGSDQVRGWFGPHAEEEIVAPHFLLAEVLSTLRRKCRNGELTPAEAREAIRFLDGLSLRLMWSWTLAERALALAEELDQPTVYDTLYLAVGEAAGCEFWTADERFARCAAPRYPFVRLLGSA
ncbi:MAG: type II toxin-antitoxin system VapC family toxin [Bacillota bacterium]|nr:type II toxin-antitoxin system VapC family toxin [Bacillota bacterium]